MTNKFDPVQKLAQRVEIDQRVTRVGGGVPSRRSSIRIDGEEFPWHLTPGGVQVHLPEDGEMPRVTLTLYAERVSVETTDRYIQADVEPRDFWGEGAA